MIDRLIRPRLTAKAFHRAILLAAALLTSLALSSAALAGPGAHGPNGEHLDAPSGAAVPGESAPKFVTQTDLFEVVGTLREDELSIFVSRFATNEPVLGASLEIETGNLKATATFHEDAGDYSVTDAPMLEALSAEGTHAVVLTILAGDEADLLDASLTVASHADHAEHEQPIWPWLVGGLAAFAAFVAFWFSHIRRSRPLAGAST